MIQPESEPAGVPARRTILYVLLGMLGTACLVILKPVLAPLIWAAILAGDRLDHYLRAAGVMTRAVIYGFLVAACAQGLVAGIGYQLVGLQAPARLGTLTGVLSVVPLLGTALVWAPAGLWFLLTGHLWQGVALLAWGTLLVHPIDNLLRPLLISAAAHVPFLLIIFGALGGMAAFGLVGAFVGPVLLGIALTIWREWATAGTADSHSDACARQSIRTCP